MQMKYLTLMSGTSRTGFITPEKPMRQVLDKLEAIQ
jgi:hypothetical protein